MNIDHLRTLAAQLTRAALKQIPIEVLHELDIAIRDIAERVNTELEWRTATTEEIRHDHD